ncbi:TonB-dependent receptor [Oscillospiraceae bacterium N12]|uniref:TonB-dependent receptor n=1 Tax=Jilunia laotingensis TaxID=2763675 RepID=A0A926IQG3_9BACT|nr:TonB-dependent receptor [Jilunia laotingensis]MBC8593520.1 TonB-dependent receptor [Jilunia laotingensis]
MIKYKVSHRVIFLITLFYSMISYGQSTLSLSGNVLDNKTREPLIGVSVVVKGTSNGTITNLDGKFFIQTTPNATLVFSYMGYASKEINIGNHKELTVMLEEKSESLDEVVVIGYGVQKKSDITGAISSVSGKDINNVPVASPLQALQGKAAGVNIVQNTGAPGGNATIKIRGTGTINDADPLYVVDGFIVDEINHLNPNDIASLEILKDAASSAVYGARAANGVVVITTKSGEKGDTKITFDTFVGVSNPWKKIDVMNIEQFALMQDYINGLTNYSTEGKLYYSKNPDTQELYYDQSKFHRIDTIRNNSPENWWDAITQTGFKQQYNLSVSGGSEKNKYMVSASYYDEKGIVKTSGYDRFNVRMNLNSQLVSWLNMNTNITYTNENRNIVPEGQNSVLKSALFQSPMVYTYNSKGYYSENHPIAVLNRNHNKMKRHRIDLNMNLTAQISKWLVYQFKVSDYIIPETWSDFTEVNKLDEDFQMPNDLTSVYKRQNLTNKWEINNLLTFSWNNKIHDLTVLAGQIAEGYKFSYQESTRKGTAGNSSDLWYLSSAYTGDKTSGLDRQWTAVGFIGRVNYNLLDRYLLQANIRVDASSIFAKSERWGYFPSVSLGWKFSSEPFMQNIEWLSLGKLRIGWGQLGNNRIDEMSRYTLLNTQYNYPYGIGNHILYPGITATTIGNPDIHWEKTETLNLGLDLSFFKNRLNIGFELFNKLTTDMLLRVPVMLSAGLDDAPMTNAGSVRNRGLELSVNHKNNIGKFKYEVGFNVSYIKNKVISLGTGNEPIYGAWLEESSILDFATKTAVGKPIGSFFGYVTDGIFNTYEEVKASAQYDYGKNDFEQTTRPGDFRFKDLNGDGRITAEDRTYLGSPLPDFVFGIPLSFSYANFDLNLFFQGQTGNKIFNVMDYYLNNAAAGNLYADIRTEHWSGQLRADREFFPLNTNASVPDLDPSDAARNFRASDFFVKDGSYIRLQELRLTYNFDEKIISKLNLSNLSIFLGAYNLFTLTRYNGFDPEVGKVTGTESNNLNMGIDHGNYPQARTFTIGLKLAL